MDTICVTMVLTEYGLLQEREIQASKLFELSELYPSR